MQTIYVFLCFNYWNLQLNRVRVNSSADLRENRPVVSEFWNKNDHHKLLRVCWFCELKQRVLRGRFKILCHTRITCNMKISSKFRIVQIVADLPGITYIFNTLVFFFLFTLSCDIMNNWNFLNVRLVFSFLFPSFPFILYVFMFSSISFHAGIPLRYSFVLFVYELPAAVNVKNAVFWNMTQYSLIQNYQHFPAPCFRRLYRNLL